MQWYQFTIQTTTEAVDLLSVSLNEIGLEGIEIRDHVPFTTQEKEQMFVDILPDFGEDDGTATILCYADLSRDPNALLDQIQQVLSEVGAFIPVGEGTVTLETTEDMDWQNNWKQYFHTFRASSQIIIQPSWEDELPEDYDPGKDQIIHLEPGSAFGSGTHETTKLCIQALTKVSCENKSILDVGCGSGILGIAAGKLNASHMDFIDVDPLAVEATGENLEKNDLRSRGSVFAGDLIGGIKKDSSYRITPLQDESYSSDGLKQVLSSQYDMILANILADVIIPLTDILPPLLRPSGIYITSGILSSRADDVAQALEQAGFTILEKTQEKEWVCFTSQLKP